MASENRLTWIVFLSLVAVIGTPFAIHYGRDALRPTLGEIRIVTATAQDPVLRDGPRTVAPGDDLTIALAVRLERRFRDDQWLAPGHDLELGNVAVPHLVSTGWPESDREARVFWFTVESSTVGGNLTADNAADRLQQRTFLAPEMGRGLVATDRPEQHNDDALGRRLESLPVAGGTFRLYARLELVDDPSAVTALDVATSAEPSEATQPSFPAIHQQVDFGPGVRPEAGELFRLPGFEPQGATAVARDEVTRQAFGIDFVDAVTRRLVTSSWTFAAVSATGTADLDPDQLLVLPSLHRRGGELAATSSPCRWGSDVLPGDLLEFDGQWLVMIGDDGDGTLGMTDAVIHCWRSPPTRTRLGLLLGVDDTEIAHFRAAG